MATTQQSTGTPTSPAAEGQSTSGGRFHRRPGGKREGRGRFGPPRRRVCPFCTEKSMVLDYKDVGLLRRFLSDRAKMLSRRQTGVCAKHQRRLATAIKRARLIALLPFVPEHAKNTGYSLEGTPR